MRRNLGRLTLVAVVAVTGTACSDSTGIKFDQIAECVPPFISYQPSTPDFSARTTKVEVESGAGPNGYYYQHNLWLIIPPAMQANAGVVVGSRVPVYLREGTAAVERYSACLIRVGDSVEVSHDASMGYGSAEAPPGAPVYLATQVVVVRP
jgi:hypothetical protein